MIVQRGRDTTERARRQARELSRFPSERTGEELDAVLAATFRDAQGRAHVLSGALRASGISGSENRPGDSWLGRFSFGGPGAEHAIFEMARGGEHDFMAGTVAYEEAFEEVIDRAVRRGG